MVQFANDWGLWALLALIPLILLYLRRPRPQERIIPSLMFLIRDQFKSNQYAFWQRFISNALFFLQLLAFLLLAFALADLNAPVPYDVSLENTIIVMDSSASMQTAVDGTTRFEQGKSQALDRLSGKNSIVLAENIPLVVLEDEGRDLAREILTSLQPKATSTNIGDAMLMAKDLLADRTGRIVVVSDFNNVDGPDLSVVRQTIENEDTIVEYIDVSSEASNIGIVRADITKHDITLFVKNYNDEAETVSIELTKDNAVLAAITDTEIQPGSLEPFYFDALPNGQSAVTLTPTDDLPVDNTLYLSAPVKSQVSTLLITNQKNSNLEKALTVSKDVALRVVNPPVLTLDVDGNKINPFAFDVIVVHNINDVGTRDGILPGTFQDISNYVKRGGKLVVTAQPNIGDFDQADVNFLSYGQSVADTQQICVDTVNAITKQFDGQPCFASVGTFIQTQASEGTVTLANVVGNPALAYKQIGNGVVLFYGIIDSLSEFQTLPAYPIFWNSVINFLEQTEDVESFNVQTGRVGSVDQQTVQTPSGPVTGSKILFDEAGYYEFEDKTVAVNVLDDQESNIRLAGKKQDAESSAPIQTDATIERDFSLAAVLLVIVLLLLLIEVVYVKRRGDL